MKILKWSGIILLMLLIIGGITLFNVSEDKPKGTGGEDADQLAQDVLTAINKPAWDTLKFLKWEFAGGHQYFWDKQNNRAIIRWKEHTVNMNLDDQTGKVFTAGEDIIGADKLSLLKEAWALWCNDSFWMFAPYKINDHNTLRTVVIHEGKKALMVTYVGGGVTPGDSYLWILDDKLVPKAYKMWVSIIPVGGVEVSWDGWERMKGGAMLSTIHNSKAISFEMKDVSEGDSWEDLGVEEPLFK